MGPEPKFFHVTFQVGGGLESSKESDGCRQLLAWAPTAAVLVVSSQTGFNHHMRYVLPMFPLAAGQQHRLGAGSVAAETVSIHDLDFQKIQGGQQITILD